MKKILSVLLVLLGFAASAYSQSSKGANIEITGRVTDELGEPLIGVSVTIKNRPGFGSMTDVDGKYSIKVAKYSTLVFSYISFETAEVELEDQKVVNVVLSESKDNILDQAVVTATGVQKKITVTGAVSNVDVGSLQKTATSSVTNALAGNVPGIIARQTTGQPGDNVSEFWIRGISTFGAGSSALVLVDGFERSLNEINVEDIQDFTVLKDASATAIYGSRGANGVVLITTKRGAEGKTKLNAKVETSYNAPTMMPKFVNGIDYIHMLNESRTTRSQQAIYNDTQVRLFENGLDPELYPNIDWMNTVLKKGTQSYRANLDLSGGGKTARYFISASYLNEGGMYKSDQAVNDYKTNANYSRLNYRMNVDLNLTTTTLLSVGVSGSLEKQNQPGGSSSEIWESLLAYNSSITPIKFKDGKWASTVVQFDENNKEARVNPWVLVTQMGYNETWKNKIQTTLNFTQDFHFVTPGLKFLARVGFDTNSNNISSHFKRPDLWGYSKSREGDGTIHKWMAQNEVLMEINSSSQGERREYLEAEIHYDRTFNGHMVGAVLKYTLDKFTDTSENLDKSTIQSIERRHQGLAGRFTYGWKYRYFIDFNFGYNGSENFATGKQYGFFPAFSVAWNLAEEPFIKNGFKVMEMFKIRYSYGKVGNDQLSIRYPYLSSFKNTTGYNLGDINSDNKYDGLTYNNYASVGITWEISTKHDVGIDFSFANGMVTGTVDYFDEKRDGIYMQRSFLPHSVGLTESVPYANSGSVRSNGFDGNVAFNKKFGNVNLTVRGNMTYSKNEILEYDEAYSRYDYTRQVGHRVGQLRGLVSEGLFKDYDDIRNSPKQTFGEVAPGDIKYKDINGDGVIDNNDVVPIGATVKPNLIYGFGVSLAWKGLDVNLHFQGAGKSSFCMEGAVSYPFLNGTWGNVFQDAVGNYWSKDVNEDPNAKYPRLSYNGNANNYRPSTYWMREGSYLRLKTVEIGYTLPKRWLSAMHFTGLRIYVMGTNLLTFSSFKLWDPEMGSTTGQQYPLSKSVTVGLTFNL